MSKDDYITDFENDNKETINELRSRINLFKTNNDNGKPLFMDNENSSLIKNAKPFIDKSPELALNTSKINVPFQSKPDEPKKDMLYEDNEQKYGDDEKFESWGDNNIFFPLAKVLMDPMRNIGLTPNHVTYMSTTMTMLSLYYLYINEVHYACVAYFFGYLFDCIDGKMARSYNMGSKFGMALDLVTDNLTNLALISYITVTKGYYNWYTILIICMSYMISLSYGLNEAIASHKAVGHDNFYNRRKEELQGESGLLYDIFLLINKGTYKVYKNLFGDYNERRLEEWLLILKHFGPGNFALFMIFILLNY
jgi:phosphatidylglycerophosphate synthase